MFSNDTKNKVKELVKQGLKENINFRVVYFSDKTEIQMVRV